MCSAVCASIAECQREYIYVFRKLLMRERGSTLVFYRNAPFVHRIPRWLLFFCSTLVGYICGFEDPTCATANTLADVAPNTTRVSMQALLLQGCAGQPVPRRRAL